VKLTRIDAVRFGALEGECLDGIGDGLTVVLGPNESGKSTYTALVRSVLFGFPMGRGKAGDRFYRPVAGDRAARLTFADGTGEWAVDRVEGKHGGAVSVTALRGPERPELLADLLGEMKEQTYKVVFGFGVDELDEIENGDDPHLTSRLYAAGAGLEMNPLDVRESLTKEAADLFKPSGRISTVNRLASDMKDLRDVIRALEAEAADFAGDQGRADRLADELEPLRTRRDELETRLRTIERDSQRAAGLAADAAALAERIAELEDAAAVQQGVLETAGPDERVLAVAAELDALLEEHSAYRQWLDSADTYLAAANAADRRVAELGELPDSVADPAEARSRVEKWATRHAQLEGEIRSAERRVATAEALGLELDAVPGAPAPSARASAAPAWVAVGAGVVFGIAGALSSQWLAVVLGAIVAGAGAVLVFLGSKAPMAADLGAQAQRAAADGRAARAEVEGARASLRSEEQAWSEWLEAVGLRGRGSDPVAVRALLDALKDRAELSAEVARQTEAAARSAAAADDWARRLAGLVRGFLDVSERPSAQDVGGLVVRAREAVASAREALARRERATEALAGIASETARARERRDERLHELEMIAATHGVELAEAPGRLESLAGRNAEELTAVRGETDARTEELASLRGRLDAGGRDAAMALARQRMEGLCARAYEAADHYAVTALAVKLLDRARERYERERQPEVTRIAGRVFSEMTAGRYTGIRVPLDGSAIAVATQKGSLRPTIELSTGAVQQLYLALRVGFLASLDAGRSLPVLMDDVVVNFDTERRAGAAAAIAELARERQVIFFTCHETTAEVLADAMPGSVRVSLDRCELRG
jgi:uncharacterized protein YhaN